MAVSSQNLDLYEPFCAEDTDAASLCNRPYSFEKIITLKNCHVAHFKNAEITLLIGCLTACMSSPKKCGAVNYDVNSTNCYLMSTNKTDKEATIGKLSD
ncbi:hypothetical protein OSTOST_19921 [Ostertagia ostertagi]